MTNRRDIEGPIHRAIVAWIKVVLPDAIIHHSPSETRRPGRAGDIERKMNAANGVLPGFPDIYIRTHVGECFMEVKAPGGRLSGPQIAFRDRLFGLGCYHYAVVHNIDDARAALASWGVWTREAGGMLK